LSAINSRVRRPALRITGARAVGRDGCTRERVSERECMCVLQIESTRKREQERASESKREMERQLDRDIGSVCGCVSLQLSQNTHTNSSCMRIHCITLLDGQRTDTTPKNAHTIFCPLAYTHLERQPLTRKHRWRQCEALGVCMSRRQHRQSTTNGQREHVGNACYRGRHYSQTS